MNFGVFQLRQILAIEQRLLTLSGSVVGQEDLLMHGIFLAQLTRKGAVLREHRFRATWVACNRRT